MPIGLPLEAAGGSGLGVTLPKGPPRERLATSARSITRNLSLRDGGYRRCAHLPR
jgi:hypothetical protein